MADIIYLGNISTVVEWVCPHCDNDTFKLVEDDELIQAYCSYCLTPVGEELIMLPGEDDE